VARVRAARAGGVHLARREAKARVEEFHVEPGRHLLVQAELEFERCEMVPMLARARAALARI
jgi:hypothetical protein